MLVSRHSLSWHLLPSSTKLEVMPIISSRFNDKDMAWSVGRERLMLSWWLFAFRLSVGEVKKKPARADFYMRQTVFSEGLNQFQLYQSSVSRNSHPQGAADVFSNNESEHIAKVHLRGGCTSMSFLISNGLSNSERRLIQGWGNGHGCMFCCGSHRVWLGHCSMSGQ